MKVATGDRHVLTWIKQRHEMENIDISAADNAPTTWQLRLDQVAE